jgi:hypothetical protein
MPGGRYPVRLPASTRSLAARPSAICTGYPSRKSQVSPKPGAPEIDSPSGSFFSLVAFDASSPPLRPPPELNWPSDQLSARTPPATLSCEHRTFTHSVFGERSFFTDKTRSLRSSPQLPQFFRYLGAKAPTPQKPATCFLQGLKPNSRRVVTWELKAPTS